MLSLISRGKVKSRSEQLRVVRVAAAVALLSAISPAWSAPQTPWPSEWRHWPSEWIAGLQGATPGEYLSLSKAAQEHLAAQRWSEAATAFRQLTRVYSADAQNWHGLATAERRLGRHSEAADAYAAAAIRGTGVPTRDAAARAAQAYAEAGDKHKALHWLNRAIVEQRNGEALWLLEDKAFQKYNQEPIFRRLATPKLPEGISRAEGWQRDLDFIMEQIALFDPEFAGGPLPQGLITRAASLRARIPTLDSGTIAVELQKLVASLAKGHSELILNGTSEIALGHALPLNVRWFPEGLFVTEAEAPYAELSGQQIVSINDRPVDQVMKAVEPLVAAEGDVVARASERYLILPYVLKAVGIGASGSSIKLGLAGKRKPVEVHSRKEHLWRNALPAPAVAETPTPLWLRNQDKFYWMEALPDHNAHYVRFSLTTNGKQETLAAFGIRLRNYLAAHPEVKDLVVDMRGNPGGNSYAYRELVRTIVDFDAQPGHRTWVLIDRSNYSASINFAVELEKFTDATFVGELAGGPPNESGDPASRQLPYSKLRLRMSTDYWNLSSPQDRRPGIYPDMPVALTAAAYFANKDPVLEATLGAMRRGR